MKKFVFRFESILKMRTDQEEEIGNELAVLIHDMAVLEEDIFALSEKKQLFIEDVNRKKEEGVSISEVRRACEGEHYFKRQMQVLSEKKDVLLDQMQIKRAELGEAMKARKVMEKLKDKAYEEYIEDFESEERKIIEEIVTYRGSVKNERV